MLLFHAFDQKRYKPRIIDGEISIRLLDHRLWDDFANFLRDEADLLAFRKLAIIKLIRASAVTYTAQFLDRVESIGQRPDILFESSIGHAGDV